jgi:hypothetical protein
MYYLARMRFATHKFLSSKPMPIFCLFLLFSKFQKCYIVYVAYWSLCCSGMLLRTQSNKSTNSSLQNPLIWTSIYKRTFNKSRNWMSVVSLPVPIMSWTLDTEKSHTGKRTVPPTLFTHVDGSWYLEKSYLQGLFNILDSYIAQTAVSENASDVERREITVILNATMQTAPMQFCYEYLRQKIQDKVPADPAGFMRVLRKIWFELYTRARGGRNDSSGGVSNTCVWVRSRTVKFLVSTIG